MGIYRFTEGINNFREIQPPPRGYSVPTYSERVGETGDSLRRQEIVYPTIGHYLREKKVGDREENRNENFREASFYSNNSAYLSAA